MVRKALRLLGSRYGIATLLLVAVIIVVGVAKANTDPGSDGITANSEEETEVAAGDPNDGVATAEPDDGAGSDSAPADDSLPPEAVETAQSFANAWIDTDGKSAAEWFEAVSVHATENLKTSLADTDPSRVPATELRGDPVVSSTSVEIDTDTGLLILRLTQEDGIWYVDGIDFENP